MLEAEAIMIEQLAKLGFELNLFLKSSIAFQ